MNKCTCNKLKCDSECLCDCHREAFKGLMEKIWLGETRANPLDKAIDLCIERMQQYKL